MTDNFQVTAMDVIKGLPNIAIRVPAIFRALKAKRSQSDSDSMASFFERSVAKYPNRPLVCYKDRMLSYTEFNNEANKMARFLVAQGVKKGDVVTLLMENRPEYLICFIAIAKVGACSSLVNNSQTGAVLSHSIKLVSPVAAIIGEELVAPFDEVRGELDIPEDQIYCIADSDVQKDVGEVPDNYRNIIELMAEESTENLDETKTITRADHLCYMYTSGTTGLPKAVIMDHNRHCNTIATINAGMNLNKNDVFYLALPLYHATGLIACWGGVVVSGASAVIRRKFSASEFWSDINKYDVTIFGYVGEMCRYLLNQAPLPTDGQHKLKKIFGNGLRPGIWMEFKTRFKIPVILEIYGASEGNTGFANILNIDNTVGMHVGLGSPELVKYDRDKEEAIKGSDGYLVKVEKGEAGLLLGKITDDSPFTGYTQSDKTEKAVFRDVFEPGDAWFNSGDLLRNVGWGHYQFVDRLGDTFRWKGENVSTTQVENILGGHPAVADCVVYGVEIPETNGKAGMAAITLLEGHTVEFDELYDYAISKLPAYAVPVFIRITGDIDTTGSFKYQKSDLKKEAYTVDKCQDPLYVVLPKTKEYVELTGKLQQEIDEGEYAY